VIERKLHPTVAERQELPLNNGVMLLDRVTEEAVDHRRMPRLCCAMQGLIEGGKPTITPRLPEIAKANRK